MKAEVMQNMTWDWMPAVALLIFVTIFVLAFIWSMRPGSTQLYNEVANNALKDGELASKENRDE